MIIKNYDTLLTHLKSINNENYQNFFILVKEAPPVKKALIQTIEREINGKMYKFLAIKDIEIYAEFRRKGYFKEIISIIESKKIPLVINDIINEDLNIFLRNKKYEILNYKKHSQIVTSRFKV